MTRRRDPALPARAGRRGPLARLADQARRWADVVDPDGAPRLTHVTFTFEEGIGLVFRDDGHGCRVAYYGGAEYARAHDEAGRPERAPHGLPVSVWLPHRTARWWPPGYAPPGRPRYGLAGWVASHGTPGAVTAMIRPCEQEGPG